MTSQRIEAAGLSLPRPTLLVDRKRALRNIERMAAKAKAARVRFRPHFKTHQSAEVGLWFRDFGIDAITVSSLEMAAYFARNGWTDITVAFPVNILELDRIGKMQPVFWPDEMTIHTYKVMAVFVGVDRFTANIFQLAGDL